MRQKKEPRTEKLVKDMDGEDVSGKGVDQADHCALEAGGDRGKGGDCPQKEGDGEGGKAAKLY